MLWFGFCGPPSWMKLGPSLMIHSSVGPFRKSECSTPITCLSRRNCHGWFCTCCTWRAQCLLGIFLHLGDLLSNLLRIWDSLRINLALIQPLTLFSCFIQKIGSLRSHHKFLQTLSEYEKIKRWHNTCNTFTVSFQTDSLTTARWPLAASVAWCPPACYSFLSAGLQTGMHSIAIQLFD